MSYNYPYANYITFENNVYAFGGSSPYIDINFGCKGNVTIRLFPTALSSCSGYAALQISGLFQNIPIDTFTDTDLTVNVNSGDALSINLNLALSTIPAGTFIGYVIYNYLDGSTPSPTVSASPTPTPSGPTPSISATPSPTPVTYSPTPTPSASQATPTPTLSPQPTPFPTPTSFAGYLWSFGYNFYGQLGNLSDANSASLVQTYFNSPIWRTLGYVNGQSNVAVKNDGTLWLWGENTYGNLSLNDRRDRSAPVQIAVGGFNWVHAALSLTNLAAIKADGGLYVAGDNSKGQLGANDLISRSLAIQTGIGNIWRYAICGNKSIFALATDNTLWAAGSNAYGQLGNSSVLSVSKFTQISSDKTWISIDSQGYSAAGVTTAGSLWLWGTNNAGQLGQNAGPIFLPSRSSPVQIYENSSGWTQVAAGYSSFYALKSDGTLWSWGSNAFGELGDGTTIDRSSPQQTLIGGNTWVALAVGVQNVVALKSDGSLFSWGKNDRSQLGNVGTTNNISSPTKISSPNYTWRALSGGFSSTSLLTDSTPAPSGSPPPTPSASPEPTFSPTPSPSASIPPATPTPCGTNPTPTPTSTIIPGQFLANCGPNNFGEIGNNSSGSTPITSFFTLPNTSNVWIYQAYGSGFGFGIRNNGTMWAWGENNAGQLGTNNKIYRSSPVQVFGGFTSWNSVSAGGNSALGIQKDGALYTWGENGYGQLASGTKINRSIPIQILGTWYAADICLTHVAGIRSNGTLWSAGNNQFGQLGNNQSISFSSLVQESTQSLWRAVSVGYGFTAAIKQDYTLWLWGSNAYGCLGLGDTNARSYPTQEATSASWSAVSCGQDFVAAIRSDGTLWLWGDNTLGQLGTNEQVSKSTPVQNYAGGTNWISVDCGYDHVVSTRYGSTQVWTWGFGAGGALGTGSLTSYSSPVQIPSPTNAIWYSVAAGGGNSSVLFSVLATPTPTASPDPTASPTPSSTAATPTPQPSVTPSPTPSPSASPIPETRLWMYGDNYFGQLGINSNVDSKQVVRNFYPTPDWRQIECSKAFSTYAIKYDGTLWGWGDNDYGQLALNDVESKSIPFQIFGGGQWSFVSGGTYHAAAIKTDGTLWSWGGNSYGVLGTNLGQAQVSSVSSPVQEITYSSWSSVSAGTDFTVAIKTDGTLWSWGWNQWGQSGSGQATTLFPSYSSPVQELYKSNTWVTVDTTDFSAAAIKVDGTLWTWGNGFYGNTGQNNNLNYSYPRPVDVTTPEPLLGWYKVAGGKSHMAGIKKNGSLWTWGRNNFGQLGDGTVINRSSPIQGVWGGIWIDVACGDDFTVAVKNNGDLWTWGKNVNFSLGNIPYTTNQSFPIQVDTGLLKWGKVSAGYSQVGLITYEADPSPTPTITGTPLPTPTPTPSSTIVPLPTLVPQFGQLWLWGDNQFGQIGDNTTTNRSSIVQTICGGQDWNNFSIRYTHTLAVKDDGTLWSWGQNNFGELGDVTAVDKSSPVQVDNGSNLWLSVSAGFQFSLALKNDGSLYSWGLNGNGQLGNASINNTSNPAIISVGPPVGWSKISAGFNHAAAVGRDGTLWCWGANDFGQIGVPVPLGLSQPVQTAIGGTDWLDVSCGKSFTLALKRNGSVWAWGLNAYGQYGNNTVVSKNTPVNVINGTNLWVRISAGNNYSAGLASGIVTTPTPTASATPLPTPSVTLSPTPTSTQPSPTPTSTGATATPTPSPSGTEATPSPTPSPSLSGTPTPTPSGTPDPTPSPTPDPARENELPIWYRIYSLFNAEFPIQYQQGQLITYAYRVETVCRPLEQPLAPFSSPQNCPARSILTIFATSVIDVCNQLNAQNWIWKINSMERYTKPVYSIEEAYLIATGQYDPSVVEFVPVTFCEYGACSDFCVDYILVENAGATFELLPICFNPVFNPETGQYDCQSSIIEGKGNLVISGSAIVKSNVVQTLGKLVVFGSAGILTGPTVIKSLTFIGTGEMYLRGSASCVPPTDSEYVENVFGKTELIREQPVVLVVDEISTLPTFTTPVNLNNTNMCNCKNIPLQISLSTNFDKTNNFNLFINRNNLLFINTFALTFNNTTKQYVYSTTYNSIYEQNNWSIIANINCNNDLDNFDIEPIWTMTIMFRNNMSTGQKLDSLIEVWLPASQICPSFGGSIINFNLTIDVKNLTCIANGNTVIQNLFINDNANLFTSPAWNNNPLLIISGSPAS
jgi:alpha-tubulin suppressor-like RCC1 family protein